MVVVVLGSMMVVGSLALLAWALQDADSADRAQVNLSRGSRDSRRLALQAPARRRLVSPFARRLQGRLGSVTSRDFTSRVSRKLELSGLKAKGWTPENILLIRAVVLAVAVVVAVVMLAGGVDRRSVLEAVITLFVGYAAPEAVLDRKVRERQAAIERKLPDVIDQLSVSVEAGLGFDAAIARSAEGRTGPLADELLRVMQDIQIGASREEALERMVERTGLPDVKQFVVAVRQSASHGLPIARVLQVQSTELRERRRSRIEAKAQQLPVKIVFPLVLCILPALFVVVLGPAGLDVFDSF